jgi:hypothetical protein
VNERIAALRRLTAAQFVARVTIVGAALLALYACTQAAHSQLPTFAVVAVVAAALLTAVVPDTHAGAVALVIFGWIWVVHVDATTSAWLLLAAPALGLFHTATAFVAGTPAHATVDRVAVERWAGRFGIIVAAAAAVWGLVTWLDRLDARPAIALTMAALIVLCGAAAALGRSTGGD